jgi:hypothetical protein
MTEESKNLDCSDWLSVGAGFQIDVAGILAVVQALQFARDNKVQYLNQYECLNCFSRIEKIHEMLSGVIEEAVAHKHEELIKNTEKKIIA